MPVADQGFGWLQAVAAFGIIVVAAFLVTWVVTDVMRVARTREVGILAVTVGALSAVYANWSGTSVSQLVATRWAWGLAAGLVAAAVAVPLVRRLPSNPHPVGHRLVGLLVWEAIVYGAAEAVLLATLPVLAVWQAASALGWTDGGWQRVASGAMAIAGVLLVILVHHLGYAEFRLSAARPKLLGALVTCGLQGLAFLLTGNILAPLTAHVLLHAQMIRRGAELPPKASGPVEVPRRTADAGPGDRASGDRSGTRPSFETATGR
jgi:hypothetical protein